ncbi:hypothetical protein K3495_g9035 [Podosphaera aphanis]|nr:hypothetical protein K3495_g9035 [Podosphaera aphanis]
MFALDFISLALSKTLPTQASSTISPGLQEFVGLGTLGIDKLNAPRISEAQKQENHKIARGWKAQSINKTVDSILASASRLEREIELETKYWEQVLDISNNGWTICRLSNERQTLGVRVGFSEGNRSLAALRRNPDGSVSLDQGISGSSPKSIRVRIHTNGNETGSTTAPLLIPDDAPVEALILQARNTVFAEEIWQELQREARSLVAYGVSSSMTTVTCELTPNKSALVDIVSLATNASSLSPKSDDSLAQGIYMALHLSLSWAHRHARRRRAQPPSAVISSPLPEPYSLIRPLLTRLIHERTMASLTAFFQPLTTCLNNASIPASHTTSRSPLPSTPSIPKAELVLTSLTAYLESTTKMHIFPGTEFTLTTRTTTFRDMIPVFQIQLNEDSAMNVICPPPGIFHTINDVREWVCWCVSCSLALNLQNSLSYSGPEFRWRLTAYPNSLKREVSSIAGVSRMITLDVTPIKDSAAGKQGVRLRARWETVHGPNANKNDLGDTIVGDAGVTLPQKAQDGVAEWIGWDVNATNRGIELIGEEDSGSEEMGKVSLIDVLEAMGKLRQQTAV